VLDVGAGDGSAALACARRGAAVTACDPVAEMVARGRARTREDVRCDVADAMALPYPDGGFDAVVSTFGAALAPHPARAASELARVTRPGGVVVLAAWVPRGLPGRLDEFAEQVSPLPQGVPSPSRWGVEAVARARLEPLLDELEIRSRSVPLRFPDGDAAFEAIAGACIPDPAGLTELRPAFDRLLASCNESLSAVEIRARYLVARGRAPALTPG
jgi:SAM-dependent methyltransferase